MPLIFVKDYVWKQSNSKIFVTLPLKYVHPSKVDIVTTEDFIKINSGSYIFQLLLFHKVDPAKTKCVIKENQIVVELLKSDSFIWHSLGRTNIGKEELIKRKEEIIKREHEKAAIERNKKEKEKEERKRMYSAYQININNAERDYIGSMKEKLKTKGLTELMDLQGKNNSINQNILFNGYEEESDLKLPIPVPFPRSAGIIKFNFSHRVLPTPKRESNKKEEEEWLKKEAEAMRATGFIAEDLTDEERNPSWLLEKGMSFLGHKNYQGAINAFSYGIKLAPKMPVFYTKLAEAQLKSDQYFKANENCTKALELLVPIVQKNKDLRAETYRIRAETWKCFNKPDLSEKDLEAAKKIVAGS